MKELSGEEMTNSAMIEIFGSGDVFLKRIEKEFHVQVVNRNGFLRLMGEEGDVEQAARLLDALAEANKQGKALDEQTMSYAISMAKENHPKAISELS